MHNDELLYNIALSKVEKVGAVTAKNLISYCGSAKEVFIEKKSRLLRIPYVGEAITNAIQEKSVFLKAEKETEFILKNNIQVLFYLNDNYPNRLKQYSDSPILLYFKGTADVNQEKIVAIVGTRRISEYGKDIVTQLVSQLKNQSVIIVSGLAYGVDSLAHRQCVISEIPTIGVLGHGLDRIYPAENKKLSLQMMECGGLLTEYGIHTKPDRENFPMRNRIVAGMSDAIVVVETKRNGGSMITAEIANSYNKDVFAFPGRTFDELSNGCNYLIKSHKAQLIENAEDLILNMRWDVSTNDIKPIQQKLFLELTEDENKIIDILQQQAEVQVDLFYQQLEFTPSILAGHLLNLEFNGIIKSLPGKRYSLIR